jgi:putative membrane protein
VSQVWHSGLQVERTALAWRRTTLAMLAASVVALRVGGLYEDIAAMALSSASLLVAGVLAWRGRGRYRQVSADLVGGRPHKLLLSGAWAAAGIVLLAVSTLLLLLGPA